MDYVKTKSTDSNLYGLSTGSEVLPHSFGIRCTVPSSLLSCPSWCSDSSHNGEKFPYFHPIRKKRTPILKIYGRTRIWQSFFIEIVHKKGLTRPYSLNCTLFLAKYKDGNNTSDDTPFSLSLSYEKDLNVSLF